MPQPPRLTYPTALDPSDPIAQLNDAFLEAYAARQRAVLAELGPSVAQVDDTLYLRIDGRRSVGPARTRLYHQLKAICHVPLALQTILGDEGGSLDEDARGQLQELSRRTDPVVEAIAEAGLDRTQLERQRRLLDASRRFIAEVLSANGVTGPTLVAFLRGQMDDIRANIADAARDQLHTTHATFSAWVADMTPEQWTQLRVVVGAGHMDRTGNLASQYFSRALGDRWEGRFEREDHDDPGRRVMTSEDVTDEESAFALLATHVFDTRTSNAFFGEESRMGRDVLADAAERELIAMFGEQPAPVPCDVTPRPARSRSASGCPRS
ncbi:hypothetical protein OV203_18950 [Nannocystis sp. ILAH1]|uniref:hypothetical protein n=1 Tax=unclassified Nannocystis TaxID=2627009 RepID=UPI00226DB7C7|nr:MULTISPECIES: hypothetical protein [unclassified Nannocystis]MCY0989224.1 hypothetical protein [Nannocystis sp. ILAH1]MCY1065083.1 hypothetical protein [Nannocystis sp. RBIL2]